MVDATVSPACGIVAKISCKKGLKKDYYFYKHPKNIGKRKAIDEYYSSQTSLLNSVKRSQMCVKEFLFCCCLTTWTNPQLERKMRILFSFQATGHRMLYIVSIILNYLLWISFHLQKEQAQAHNKHDSDCYWQNKPRILRNSNTKPPIYYNSLYYALRLKP